MADSKIPRAWVVAIGLISLAIVLFLIVTFIEDTEDTEDTPMPAPVSTPKTEAISLTESDVSIEEMDSSEIGGDCGCSFYHSKEPFNHKDNKFVFGYSFFDHRAVIKINGKLVHMQNHKYRDQPPEIDGTKINELEFIKNSTQLRAQFKLDAECSASSDKCEGAYYGGTLNVKHNDKDVSLPIWGYCGC